MKQQVKNEQDKKKTYFFLTFYLMFKFQENKFKIV